MSVDGVDLIYKAGTEKKPSFGLVTNTFSIFLQNCVGGVISGATGSHRCEIAGETHLLEEKFNIGAPKNADPTTDLYSIHQRTSTRLV